MPNQVVWSDMVDTAEHVTIVKKKAKLLTYEEYFNEVERNHRRVTAKTYVTMMEYSGKEGILFSRKSNGYCDFRIMNEDGTKTVFICPEWCVVELEPEEQDINAVNIDERLFVELITG